MKHINKLGLVLLLFLSATIVFGQNPRTVLAQGEPPLTQEMVTRLASVYETILDIKLDVGGRARFQKGVIEYWTTRNADGIAGSLTNLKYYGQPDELAALKNSSQNVIIESLRRDIEATGDEVSKVLVEAFDAAHADRRMATRAKTFNDLIGVWKRTDSLLAEKPSYGGQMGVSYTDAGTLEIKPDGSYKLVKVHNYYGSGCSRMDGSTESGTVTAKGTNLIFQIKSGSTETKDGCVNRDARTTVKPHTETLAWSIRPNPDNDNIATLCINTGKDTAACYEKQ
ncbi:MAG TPA: hypothetical protein VGC97_18860 [Pyrinomonadaceae bacterium]|jgi:hypothetical protein